MKITAAAFALALAAASVTAHALPGHNDAHSHPALAARQSQGSHPAAAAAAAAHLAERQLLHVGPRIDDKASAVEERQVVNIGHRSLESRQSQGGSGGHGGAAVAPEERRSQSGNVGTVEERQANNIGERQVVSIGHRSLESRQSQAGSGGRGAAAVAPEERRSQRGNIGTVEERQVVSIGERQVVNIGHRSLEEKQSQSGKGGRAAVDAADALDGPAKAGKPFNKFPSIGGPQRRAVPFGRA